MFKLTEKVRTYKVRTTRSVKQGRRVKVVERTRTRRTTVKVDGVAARKPQGVILYRGPSLLDGSPIVAVAVGLARPSKNPKTGAGAIQTYILADAGDTPVDAWKNGGDRAVCGDCPHRGTTCYVNIVQAPLSVYRAVQRGTYPVFDPAKHLRHFVGRFIRLGSYGDPAAVPLDVWETVCDVAASHTGYTHQWASCEPGYARLCMASVETPHQRQQAMDKGFRTFRVRLPEQPVEQGEFICPAAAEAGRRLTCEECGACSGAKAGGRRAASPTILFHGSTIAGNRTLRMYRQTMDRLQAEEVRAGRVPLSLAN